MAKRRDPGDGSIYYNKGKARWEGSISVGSGPDRVRRSVSSRIGRAAVRARLEELKRELRPESKIDPRMPISVLGQMVYESAQAELRPASRDLYQYQLGLINEHIGSVRLCDMSEAHARMLFDTLGQKHAARTVRQVRTRLGSMLSRAMKAGAIRENAAKEVRPPRIPQSEIYPFSEDESARVLATARGHRHEATFGLGIIRGMRRGEILGLRWPYVDFERKKIQIAWALQAVRIGKTCPLALLEVKTDSSRRTIEMTSQVREMLLRRREIQFQERVLAQRRWSGNEHQLVFTTSTGRPIRPGNLKRSFDRLQARAGVSPRRRIHDCRHTCAALMLQARESPNVVSRLLGHKSVAFTLSVYGHLIPGMEADASQRLEDRIFQRVAGDWLAQGK